MGSLRGCNRIEALHQTNSGTESSEGLLNGRQAGGYSRTTPVTSNTHISVYPSDGLTRAGPYSRGMLDACWLSGPD